MPRMPAATDTPATGVAPPATMAAAPTMPARPVVGVPPGAPPPRIASGDPDTFVSTGLANNFNGRVVSGWLLPRKYKTGRKANTYSLTWELAIQADDHTIGKDGLVIEYLKIDNLNQWVPSATDPTWNGTEWVYTPAGGDLASYLKLHNGEAGFPTQTPGETAVLPPQNWYGYYAIPGAQNSRDSFMKGTKFAQFGDELKRLDYKKKAPHVNWGDFRQFMIGVYGKWVRIPFTFSGGGAPPADAAGQGEMSTLCLAEILDLGPISGAGGPVAVPSAQTLTAQLPTQAPAPAPVAAPAAAVPAPIAVGQTFSTAPGMTPQEIAQQVAAVAAPAPAPTAAAPAPAVQQVEPNPQRNDPAAISAAANEIITQIVAARGQATKSELGSPVMEGVAARGLDGATALRLLNTPDWLVDDERTFGWVPEKAMAVRLP